MSDPDVYRRLRDIERWRDAMAAVERSRFVGARYSTNAGQVLVSGIFSVVDFEDVTYDPLSLVTTGASWVFTCPIDGYYLVSFCLTFNSSAAWATGENSAAELFKNGVRFSSLDFYNSWQSGASATFTGSDLVPCVRNDTLQIQALQSSGANISLFAGNAYNYVVIARIG